MESGTARTPIMDWHKYENDLRTRMGYENKMMMNFIEEARLSPKRVVFGKSIPTACCVRP